MTKTDETKGMRILIVEDEALIAEEIQDRLTRLGFETVAIADTSEKAIASAERNAPDLVLMDIRIKGPKDGIETATFIRLYLNIPVVYLTAHSDQATLKRAKDSGPFGYVLKPFQERELLVAIEMATHMHILEQRVKDRTAELEETVTRLQRAFKEIKSLRGFKPVCSSCRRFRNEKNAWKTLEYHLNDPVETEITRGLCPECMTKDEELQM